MIPVQSGRYCSLHMCDLQLWICSGDIYWVSALGRVYVALGAGDSAVNNTETASVQPQSAPIFQITAFHTLMCTQIL